MASPPVGVIDSDGGQNRGYNQKLDRSWRLAALASAGFALSVVLSPLAATLLALVGLVLLLLSLSPRARAASAVTALRLNAAVVAVALVAITVPQALNGSPSFWLSRALPAMAVLLTIWNFAFPSASRRLKIVATSTLLVVAIGAGARLIDLSRDTGLDIVLLHKGAAAALSSGTSPYSDAVRAPNGAPGLPAGSQIVGYPYPPVVAAPYAAGTWALGDPRWIGLVCWIALLLSIHQLAARANGSAIPVLLFAAFPGWGLILQSGWTEPLSGAMLGFAALLWNNPIASGMALGAALGSKQYFIAVVPLLVLYRGEGWLRRSTVAIVVALGTLLPAFVWSAADAWRSLVLFHTQTPLRADSGNVVGVLAAAGIRWAPPAWFALLLAFGTVAVLARRIHTPAQFWRATAIALGILFMLSRQAMPNYWYLVAVTALLGSLPGSAVEEAAAGTGHVRNNRPLPNNPLSVRGS